MIAKRSNDTQCCRGEVGCRTVIKGGTRLPNGGVSPLPKHPGKAKAKRIKTLRTAASSRVTDESDPHCAAIAIHQFLLLPVLPAGPCEQRPTVAGRVRVASLAQSLGCGSAPFWLGLANT